MSLDTSELAALNIRLYSDELFFMTTIPGDDLQALLRFQLSLMKLEEALRESSKSHSPETKQLQQLIEQRHRQ